MNGTRWLLGAAGAALAGFGVFRLLTTLPFADLRALAVWLVVAVALHDGVLAPACWAIGGVVQRLVPARLRAVVSATLVAGAGVTAITIPLALRRGTQPAAKALLRQNYVLHLVWLWIALAVAAATVFTVRALRPRTR